MNSTGKKPKDEISGTVRLDEYGVHPDLGVVTVGSS